MNKYFMNKDIDKTHVKFTKAILVKEDQKLQKLQSIFQLQEFSKDYMDLTKLSEIQHLEKYRILFQLQKTGNVTKGTWNGKLFFSIYKNCWEVFLCKGVTLEVKLVGRFKVFLRDSCVKKKKHFCRKVSSYKVQNGGF